MEQRADGPGAGAAGAEAATAEIRVVPGSDDPGERTSLDEQVLQRLRSVEGHVRGIARMVERGEYCVDVVHQILATQRALERVRVMVLDRHLHTCVTSAIRGDDVGARERAIREVLQVVQAAGR